MFDDDGGGGGGVVSFHHETDFDLASRSFDYLLGESVCKYECMYVVCT